MRDIVITLIVFGSLPFILKRPFTGLVMWTWLSLMNPHRLAWGFSLRFPFAEIVFITTVLSYVMSQDTKKIPFSREVVVLIVFVLWMFITTVFSLSPDYAWLQWDKIWRIQLGILLTLMLTSDRKRIEILVWTIAISLGFYGYKGGIWTVLSGGANRVYGPDGTFIGGNNELGLALVMTVPLIWYLVMSTKQRWPRLGLYGAMIFTPIAIIGTHSRGAMVGLVAMGMVFLLKSRKRLIPLLIAVALVCAMPVLMPQSWFDRMSTINTYEQDQSAMERLDAWQAAYVLANKRFHGGGFGAVIFVNGTDAHSIYFQILGEQGYPGLGIFLLLGGMAYSKAKYVQKKAGSDPELKWAQDLALMIQVSLVGYATCGAFLGLGYFDFFYLLVALVVVLERTIRAPQALFAKQVGGISALRATT